MKQLQLNIHIDNRRANTIIGHLNKKISFQSSKNMEELLELIKILYINGKFKECLECCKITNELEFNGNFAIWDFIHPIWQYHSLLLKIKGDNDASKAILKEIDEHYKVPINALLNTPEKAYALYLKIRNRKELDSVTYQSKIEQSEGDVNRQLDWKFIALSKLIEPIIMDNMKNISVEIANEYFEQYCTELRESKKYGIS